MLTGLWPVQAGLSRTGRKTSLAYELIAQGRVCACVFYFWLVQGCSHIIRTLCHLNFRKVRTLHDRS
ncbi:protein of unknown function [Thauera humireducens]|nr:protein of unknown function [Thauera humireducens]